MKGENLLKHALQIVEDRRAQYGDSTLMFKEIAARWSLTLDRIEVLTSKGYIKFMKEGAARSRNGFLCVEGMEVPTDKTDGDK